MKIGNGTLKYSSFADPVLLTIFEKELSSFSRSSSGVSNSKTYLLKKEGYKKRSWPVST